MVSERIELSFAISGIEILQRYIIYVKLTIGFRKKISLSLRPKKRTRGGETRDYGTTIPRPKVPRPESKG
jgi:hypothetical protein